MEKIAFKVKGLDCADEVRLIQDVLGKEKGVKHIDCAVISAKATITYDPKKIDSQTIRTIINSTGLEAVLYGTTEEAKPFVIRHLRLILTILSGLFLLAGTIAHYVIHQSFADLLGGAPSEMTHSMPWIARLLYTASIVAAVWLILPKAFVAIKRLRPDIHLLIIVAVIGAGIIDEWFEAAMVAFLFSVAILLEGWSVGRARRAIASLMELAPTLAREIVSDGKLVEKEVDKIKVGARLLIRPGEKIPLDGVVAKGVSTVDQSPITGESLPVLKEEGDELFAGTLNQEGALECTVTKKASETTLATIVSMVEEARAKRSLSEQFVERFARIYTPIMMALSILVMVIPPLLFGGIWTDWLYQGLVLLVIACPCALVIATPVAVVSGLARAAKAGVLIKGGIYLELAAKIKSLAIDKTGTLTYGKPVVQKMVPLNDHTEEQLLQKAASMERQSEHPLAHAILTKAEERGISLLPVEQFKNFQGKGAEAIFQGRSFWIGSHRFMHEKGQETKEVHQMALKLEDAGHSVIAIGTDDHVCGLISVADQPREHLKETLLAIREAGIQHIAMLTGDNAPTAKALAKLSGVDSLFAECLPQDKVEAVLALKEKYESVAMIGDGVNDAPALAAATLGIAMGNMGTDAAIETADIALMTDELKKVPWLIRHAKRTYRIIWQNVLFALSVKGLFVILALFNLATLWLAIAADTGATLLVVFNSLRLLRR